jgi:hypothetical protein
MQKSILVEILRSLEKKEQRDLRKWLQSPSHNQRQDVVQLFDYLTEYLSKYDQGPEKEKAWPAIYPGEAYDDSRMRQVMFFLSKAVEDYLAFEAFKAQPAQYYLALARLYRGRKLDKAYRQSARLSREQLNAQPIRNGDYLRHNFDLEQEEYDYRIGITQNAPVNLQETADALERYFLSEKFKIALAMLAHHAVYQKANYTSGLMDAGIAYAQANGELLEEPAVAMYYYAYMTITHPTEEQYFDEFEQLIQKHTDLFYGTELRNFYLAALNYCVTKINQGRQDFARRAFELYKRGLETGVLLENNMLSRYTFGNAVGAALKTGEFAWAEKFIRDFEQHLEEKERKSIVHFNLSRVYFEKGDYDKAQRLLFNFEYDDMLLNIIAKTMLLKIYYEQTELDAFESLLESMRIYLKRKEALDTARKTAYKNMISLMRKMLNTNPYSKAQMDRLRQDIENTHPLMEREWLLRQIG